MKRRISIGLVVAALLGIALHQSCFYISSDYVDTERDGQFTLDVVMDPNGFDVSEIVEDSVTVRFDGLSRTLPYGEKFFLPANRMLNVDVRIWLSTKNCRMPMYFSDRSVWLFCGDGEAHTVKVPLDLNPINFDASVYPWDNVSKD